MRGEEVLATSAESRIAPAASEQDKLNDLSAEPQGAKGDQAAASRLPKSSGSKILPLSSTISTCQPSLAHTFALATMISELTRSIQTVSSSRSAIIWYAKIHPLRSARWLFEPEGPL